MNKGSLEFIKKINTGLVLDCIRAEQPISRAKIAVKTKLSRSTVSIIVDELIKKKFVYELGYAPSTKEGGRRGIELGFNPTSGYGVGIDLHANKAMICITDLDGNLVYKEQRQLKLEFASICEFIHDSIDKASLSLDQILAIAYSIPGIVDTELGVVIEAPELRWSDVRLAHEMEQFIAKPTFVLRDVNSAAFGERWIGAAKQISDMIYISIGFEGVGAAIVANDVLITGYQNMAGEIGYFTEVDDYNRNLRNKKNDLGVFDKKASRQVLLGYELTLEELFGAYRNGESIATKIVQTYVMNLSVNIANVISLLNPHKVIIGGYLHEYMDAILPDLQKLIADLTPIQTQIELSSLGDSGAAIGAVAFALEQIQSVN